MAPNRRLPRPFHFEQPFALAATPESLGNAPVVGAIVTGPLGALVQRAFSAAFTAVERASAAQKLAASAAGAAKPAKPAKKSIGRTKPARRTKKRSVDNPGSGPQ